MDQKDQKTYHPLRSPHFQEFEESLYAEGPISRIKQLKDTVSALTSKYQVCVKLEIGQLSR